MQNKRRRLIRDNRTALIFCHCHIVLVRIQTELIIAFITGADDCRISVTVYRNFRCDVAVCIDFVHFHRHIFQLLFGFLHDAVAFDGAVVVCFIDPCPAAVSVSSGNTQHIGSHGGVICLMLCQIFFHRIYMNRCRLYDQLSGRSLCVGNFVGNCRMVIFCANAGINDISVTVYFQCCASLSQFPCCNRVLIVSLRQCISQPVISRCQIRQHEVALISVIVAFGGISHRSVKRILIGIGVVFYNGFRLTSFLVNDNITCLFRIRVAVRIRIGNHCLTVNVDRIALLCQQFHLYAIDTRIVRLSVKVNIGRPFAGRQQPSVGRHLIFCFVTLSVIVEVAPDIAADIALSAGCRNIGAGLCVFKELIALADYTCGVITRGKGVPLSYALHLFPDCLCSCCTFVLAFRCRCADIFRQIQRRMHLVVKFQTVLFVQSGVGIIHLCPDRTDPPYQPIVFGIRDPAGFVIADQFRQLDKIRILSVYILIQIPVEIVFLGIHQIICRLRENADILQHIAAVLLDDRSDPDGIHRRIQIYCTAGGYLFQLHRIRNQITVPLRFSGYVRISCLGVICIGQYIIEQQRLIFCIRI